MTTEHYTTILCQWLLRSSRCPDWEAQGKKLLPSERPPSALGLILLCSVSLLFVFFFKSNDSVYHSEWLSPQPKETPAASGTWTHRENYSAVLLLQEDVIHGQMTQLGCELWKLITCIFTVKRASDKFILIYSCLLQDHNHGFGFMHAKPHCYLTPPINGTTGWATYSLIFSSIQPNTDDIWSCILLKPLKRPVNITYLQIIFISRK